MLSNEDYAKAFHEIKNSVTIVSSSIQLLGKKHPELAADELWLDSTEALDHLKRMVQELSQVRLSSGFPLQLTNLNTLLNNVRTSIQSVMNLEGCSFQISMEDGLPLIEADSMRLTQAIMNLLKNAFESMQMKGTVLLEAYRQNTSVRIDITDFGGGIAPEYISTLFTPFVTSKADGTGLGLCITKQIIANHHGILDFVSRPGDGCTFSIMLPIPACENDYSNIKI